MLHHDREQYFPAKTSYYYASCLLAKPLLLYNASYTLFVHVVVYFLLRTQRCSTTRHVNQIFSIMHGAQYDTRRHAKVYFTTTRGVASKQAETNNQTNKRWRR